MNDIHQDVSASGMVHAIEANLFALIPVWGLSSLVESHSEPGLLWNISSVPFPLFNLIARARLSSENAADAIEAAKARAAARHVPMLWWTGPSSTPVNLPSLLEAHGFISEGDAPAMAVALRTMNENTPAPAGLRIEPVLDLETLKTWCHVLCVGFEMPTFVENAFIQLFCDWGFGPQMPFRNYLGWLADEPVATSSWLPGGGVAGIYNVTTLAQARRKGIGAAMTLAPLQEARAAGFEVGMLFSSQMGFNIYRQLGFREYCKLGQYVWGGDQHKDDRPKP